VLEETRIVARRTPGGELELDSYDANQLFERAYAMTTEGRCLDAIPLYDRIASEFPTSRYVSPALYNAGLCLQRAGQLEPAVQRFERLLAMVPQSSDAKHAQLLLAEALVDLERWEAGLTAAEALLDREDLTPYERLEAMARRAQSLFGLARNDDAERAAREALTYYRTRQGDEAIADEYFAAAANFVLAETIRTRAEALALPIGDVASQSAVLDRRAQLLLDAQRAYFDTIRLTDARWAAASGYRIGAMYQALYAAITEAPVPPPSREMSPDALEIYRREYRGQLADRVRPLMRHAIRYWELTLLMVERTGVEPLEREWVERTRTELERARELLVGPTSASPRAASETAIPE
jgi:tetratricopeptide (TPR) repeat protein